MGQTPPDQKKNAEATDGPVRRQDPPTEETHAVPRTDVIDGQDPNFEYQLVYDPSTDADALASWQRYMLPEKLLFVSDQHVETRAAWEPVMANGHQMGRSRPDAPSSLDGIARQGRLVWIRLLKNEYEKITRWNHDKVSFREMQMRRENNTQTFGGDEKGRPFAKINAGIESHSIGR